MGNQRGVRNDHLFPNWRNRGAQTEGSHVGAGAWTQVCFLQRMSKGCCSLPEGVMLTRAERHSQCRWAGSWEKDQLSTWELEQVLLQSCCLLGRPGVSIRQQLLPLSICTGHCPGQEAAKEISAVSLPGHLYVIFSIPVDSPCWTGFRGFFLACLYLFSYFGMWQYRQLFNLKVLSWLSGSPETITSS